MTQRSSRIEEKESEEITELPRKHALLILKCESDSDIPDLKIDMEDGTESQDDKANQVKEKEPVGITKPPRKQTLLTTTYKSDSPHLIPAIERVNTIMPKRKNLQTYQNFRENMNQNVNQTQTFLIQKMLREMTQRPRMIRPAR